ncbi:MAG: xanthine dehydrogenase molybdopterin binding subunit [Myxococcota bacterium]
MTPKKKHVGRPIPHESAREHVTGAAVYTDDIVPRMAGVVHAWPVCAKVAHGRVLSIQTDAALAAPGVVTVLTDDDVPGEGNVGAARKDEPLFPAEILHHNQAVAWVLGESEAAARAAAALVEVEVEALPPILTIEDAIAKDSFHTDPLRIERLEEGVSSLDAALTGSAGRVSGEVHVGGQEHFYLEAQAALVYVDEGGQVFVHASTQHPTETQIIVARVLGVPAHEVTCQSLRMGGAFGGKEVQANAWACVAAVGAVKTGRPVRVRLDRQRDLTLTGKRHPFLGRYDASYDAEGRLKAMRVELYSDGGWSLDLSKPVLFRAMFHVDNAYYLPNIEVVGRVCKTHKTSQTAFRGFGGPQGMVVIEEVMDRIARATGLSPHVVRERNLYQEGHKAHYGQTIADAPRMHRIWERLWERSDFQARFEAIEEFNRTHPNRKRGIAITPVKFGISFTTAFFNQAGALVLLYADGSVQVNHGGTEMGQGLHTKMLQVAADALGVDLETVRLMPTRTDKVPNTSATAASSGTDLNGQAVRDACQAIRERLATVAGTLFGCAPEDIVFADGKVHPIGRTGEAMDFGKVAKQAYLQRVPLFAAGYYRTPNIHYDEDAGVGKPFHYYAFGASVTEVEVDRFTGQYDFRRVDIVHDVGDSLSPLVDRGQVEGGFIQGLGWLTREELIWDADGRLMTAGASTYKLPTLDECPEDFFVELLPKAPQPGVIHGSKAVGEPPFMLAISAREALRHAVSAFGESSRVDLGCPATPEAVFWALEQVGAAQADVAAAEE